MIAISACVATLWMSLCSVLVVAKDLTDSPRTGLQGRAEFFIHEALSAREEVRSGHVRISGQYRYHVVDGEAGFDGPVVGLFLFDREAHLYRYDGQWPCKTQINDPGDYSIRSANAATPTYTSMFGFCRARDYFADWHVVGSAISTIQLRPLKDEAANRHGSCGTWPIDVMALGMFSMGSREKGLNLLEAYTNILKFPQWQIVEEDAEVAHLRAAYGDVSAEMDFNLSLAAPTHWNEVAITTSDKQILFETHTEWRKDSDVVVPYKYSAQYSFPGVALEKLELTLEWVSINEPIPENEFSYKAFTGVPLDKPMEVYDRRGKDPVHLGRWIAAGGVIEPPAEYISAKASTRPDARNLPSHSQAWWILLAINALFALVLAVIWRRKRKADAS